MNYNVDSTRKTGRSEFPKIRYLAGKQCMRPTHDTQYAIFMDKTFCRGAHAKKNRCSVCFSGNCFSREKNRHVIPDHHVVFNIYMCARRIARTNRVVDFDFAFSLCPTYILTKEKNRRANTRREFFLNAIRARQIETRTKNLSARLARLK